MFDTFWVGSSLYSVSWSQMKENTKYCIFYQKGSSIMLAITEKGMKPEYYQFCSYQEGFFPPPYLPKVMKGDSLLEEVQGAGISRAGVTFILCCFQTGSLHSKWHFPFLFSFSLVVLSGSWDRHFCFMSLYVISEYIYCCFYTFHFSLASASTIVWW